MREEQEAHVTFPEHSACWNWKLEVVANFEGNVPINLLRPLLDILRERIGLCAVPFVFCGIS